MDTLTESDVADLLDDLAQLLPFPTTLYTDMGADRGLGSNGDGLSAKPCEGAR